MFHWSLDPIGDSYLLVIVAALGLLGLLLLGPSRERASRGKRIALASLRAAAIALVLLAMLRPTLIYTQTRLQPATLVILCDKSRSMSVPDGIGGTTRYEALARALDDAQSALDALGENFEIKAYAFDGQLTPLEVEGGRVRLPERPNGQQTAIGANLRDALAQEAGKRLLGVILLSDGAQQARAPRDEPAQTAASRFRALGYKLYTLPLGLSRGLGDVQDLRLVDLRVNPTVFVKNELTIAGDLQADGYVNHEVPVRLLFETPPGEMKEVLRQKIDVTAVGQRIPIDMTYVPEMPGEYKLTLEVVPQPGELVTTNNQLSTFVRVLKGGLNVLYLAGDLRVESKFIRRSLATSPDIKVDFYRLRYDPKAPADAPPRQRFPRPSGLKLDEAFRPGKYEVYILGDLDSSAFTSAELAQLADAVSKGAGLIMLGGFHTFGPGGYGQTPLAEVLPVEMARHERQGFGERIATDLHLRGPLRMTPSRVGQIHFALRLAAGQDANRAAWAQLPPLEGANRLRNPPPGAMVLATDGANHPLLISHYYGAGRVMAFAGDSTWRWWMHGRAAAHKRFWRQVVLWLARKDESTEGDVWIRMAGRRFAPGQRAEFTVGANDATGEAIDDAAYKAEVVLPDQTRMPIQLVSGPDGLTGSFHETGTPGDYAVEVTATKDGQPLGSARARFLVYQQDLELDNAAADVGAMRSLAAITGGESLAPEQLPALIERLAKQSAKLEVDHIAKLTFWDTWPYFLALVALLSAEWYLRKRWGLV